MSKSQQFDETLAARLLETEIVTEAELGVVRELQSSTAIGLAEALVQLELLSDREMERIIHSVNELRTVKLEQIQIDPNAVRHVPKRVALANRCLPVRRTGNTLVVAYGGGDFEAVREALRAVTDFDIVVLAAEQSALEHAQFIHYGDSTDISTVNSGTAMPAVPFQPAWGIPMAWRLTFDTLIEHDGIVKGREIAKQIASRLSESSKSPILFVGPKGCGKTHILKAVRNYVSSNEPTTRGLYCTGAQFAESLASHYIAGTVEAFRFDLRDRDLVLIDDVADLYSSSLCERELENLINVMLKKGGVVALTMTDEAYIAGPNSVSLKELFGSGTEVILGKPSRDSLKKMVLNASQGKNCSAAIEIIDRLNDDYVCISAVRNFVLEIK